MSRFLPYRIPIIALLLVGLAGCGGASPRSLTPSAMPTGPGSTDRLGAQASSSQAATQTDDTGSPGAGPTGGTGAATIALGGTTTRLDGGSRCVLENGVHVSLSGDGGASLNVFITGSVVALFVFARPGEQWQPAGTPATFDVSGSNARWSGSLQERTSGQEEQATIEIICGGGG